MAVIVAVDIVRFYNIYTKDATIRNILIFILLVLRKPLQINQYNFIVG